MPLMRGAGSGLLPIIEMQDRIIHDQQETITRLANQVAELEAWVSAVVEGEKEIEEIGRP